MEFWLDEKIGSLPPEARLLYIGTWSLADDNGVLRGNPAYIRSQLFAYDEEVTPATSAATPADVFAQRAAQIRGLIGERYPHIAAMHEPLRDDQLRWIAERYAMEDVRRILSDMDDKRVYDPHSRSYRTKTFNAFMAFADCDRMVGGVGRRADGAGGMAPSRPSKRLYTYEEMCDEIPSRARQEDFTMVEIGGRKLWQKRVVV